MVFALKRSPFAILRTNFPLSVGVASTSKSLSAV